MQASDLTEARQKMIANLQALSASIAAKVSQAMQDALGAGGARNNTPPESKRASTMQYLSSNR